MIRRKWLIACVLAFSLCGGARADDSPAQRETTCPQNTVAECWRNVLHFLHLDFLAPDDADDDVGFGASCGEEEENCDPQAMHPQARLNVIVQFAPCPWACLGQFQLLHMIRSEVHQALPTAPVVSPCPYGPSCQESCELAECPLPPPPCGVFPCGAQFDETENVEYVPCPKEAKTCSDKKCCCTDHCSCEKCSCENNCAKAKCGDCSKGCCAGSCCKTNENCNTCGNGCCAGSCCKTNENCNTCGNGCCAGSCCKANENCNTCGNGCCAGSCCKANENRSQAPQGCGLAGACGTCAMPPFAMMPPYPMMGGPLPVPPAPMPGFPAPHPGFVGFPHFPMCPPVMQGPATWAAQGPVPAPYPVPMSSPVGVWTEIRQPVMMSCVKVTPPDWQSLKACVKDGKVSLDIQGTSPIHLTGEDLHVKLADGNNWSLDVDDDGKVTVKCEHSDRCDCSFMAQADKVCIEEGMKNIVLQGNVCVQFCRKDAKASGVIEGEYVAFDVTDGTMKVDTHKGAVSTKPVACPRSHPDCNSTSPCARPACDGTTCPFAEPTCPRDR